MAKAGTTVDIVIDDLTNQTGFILRKPRASKGEAEVVLGAEFSPVLNPGYYTGVAAYANTQPDREFAIPQTDWRRGAGEVIFQERDPAGHQYASAVNTDARFINKIVAGPRLIAAASVAFGTENLAITNGGFETYTTSPGVPDSWSNITGTVTYTKETTIKRTGSNSVRMNTSTAAAYLGLSQNIDHSPAAENVQVTVGAYYYVAAADGADIDVAIAIYERGVEKAVTTVTSPTTDAWTAISVNYTPASGESPFLQVRLLFQTAGGAGTNYAYWDDVTITCTESTPTTLGTITCFAIYGNDTYMGSSNGVFKWDNGNTRWDFMEGSPRYVTSLAAYYDGTTDYLMVACGLTKSYWFYNSTTAPTFQKTQLAAPDDKAEFFCAIGTTIWKNETATSVASSTAGSSWTAPVTVGYAGYSITGLLNHGNNPYIGKTNGWYYWNGTSAEELIPELAFTSNANSGKVAISFDNRAYAAFGAQDLYEYTRNSSSSVSSYKTISLSDASLGVEEYSGRVAALAADAQYLFAFGLDAANSHVYLHAGRYESVEGQIQWVWHPIGRLTGTDVKCATVSGSTSPPRLWFVATVSGTDTPYYSVIPDNYADVTTATSYTFQTGGTHTTGWLTAGFPLEIKVWASRTIYSKSLTANITIGVAYDIDDGNGFVSLGTANTSPVQTLYFSTSAVTSSRRIRFQYTFNTNDNTKTPQLISSVLRGHITFPRRKDFYLPIVIEDNQTTLQGGEMESPPLLLEGRLRNAANLGWVKLLVAEANTSGVLTETTYYVHILSMKETQLRAEQGRYGTRLFEVGASEVKLA